MKKSAITLGTLALLSIVGIPSLVKATTIDLPENAPKSGYVAFNDQDEIVESSSATLKKLATNSSTKPQFKTAINMANSRWVYFSDHHNYINGYKWSHSNYYHTKEYHTSTAAVSGHDRTRREAKAKQWSFATAAGKGTAQAWYWAPYT